MTEEQKAEWRRNHAAEMEQRRIARAGAKAIAREQRRMEWAAEMEQRQLARASEKDAERNRIAAIQAQIRERIKAAGGSTGRAGVFWPIHWYGREVVITPSLRRGPEAVPVCGVLVTSDRYAVTLECEGERREVKLVTGDLMTLARRESLVG